MNAGFFTRTQNRFEVPHERIGVRWLLLVHACIAKAFATMRSRGDDLQQASENAITNELENLLANDLQRPEGDVYLDPDFFWGVTRGSEVENHNGRKISKKPDLIFHLRRSNALWDRRQDALFAECKWISKKRTLRANYCSVGKDSSGIERFVVGDYAWAMQEALMIGYVLDGLRVIPDLEKTLATTPKRGRLGHPSAPELVISDGNGQAQLVRTTHERTFTWRNGRRATPIDLFHSWHACD